MSDLDALIVPEMAGEQRGVRWSPVVGAETIELLKDFPAETRDAVQQSAASILARAVPPSADAGEETGLIVGYVQSGKTLSFTAVTTLARDNGFQVVIIIAGTSDLLLEQSTKRLRRDLQIDDIGRRRAWIQLTNPGDDEVSRRTVWLALEEWADASVPRDECQTVVITVLKHHRRLAQLNALFESLDLRGVPILVIDDEADQASINTEINQGDQSSTYRRILDLKGALPHHSYLQYTATPQAPLLINIIDALSPNFVEVLEPGADYTGGRTFFVENPELVRRLDPADVPTNDNPLSAPPASLMEALRVFMVGVAVGLFEGGGVGNRSMLVHPSVRVGHHEEYVDWIRQILDNWRRILTLDVGDPDRAELVEGFRDAYADLKTTVELPEFSDVERMLIRALRRTRVLEVNRREGETAVVEWPQSYAWILVGGQALDRGFTVEGLTVTYMPRGLGVGNADTLQQRARFFGYRLPFLGFCRVYLETSTRAAFQAYVEHEEDIRKQLQVVQAEDRPLDAWKRAFILSDKLRPTRAVVLEFDYMKGRYSDAWFMPNIVLASDDILQANRDLIADFSRRYQFTPDPGSPQRTDAQRHEMVSDVLLRDVMALLLVAYRVIGATDSAKYTGLRLQLSQALERNVGEVATVYRMSPGFPRMRSVNENGSVSELHQGAAPVSPRELRGTVYPGDSSIRNTDQVTVQIHSLVLKRDDAVVAENVPVLAVWVPHRLGAGWYVQHNDDDVV